MAFKNRNSKELNELIKKASQDLKKYFDLSSHDIRQYLKTGQTLMNEWNVVGFEQKDQYQQLAT